MKHKIQFLPQDKTAEVPAGATLSDAAELAGIEIHQPCGGQGRCGRCIVKVEAGEVRRRSTLRLSWADIAEGYALACQSVVVGDAVLTIPPQEKVRRSLTTDKTAVAVELPFPYSPELDQTLKAVYVEMEAPSMADQTDDWSRLKRALAPWLDGIGLSTPTLALPMLRRLGSILRMAEWRVTVVLETGSWDQSQCPPRVINVRPGFSVDRLWGIAVDIGTTTVTVYLVDLVTARVVAQAAEYNGQIARGEDVISRIIYASKAKGDDVDGNRLEMQRLVVRTINHLIDTVAERGGVDPLDIDKATVVGNSTMIHLLLGLDASSIRLDPFVTAVNQPPVMTAGELDLNMNPAGMVDLLPGVASYVGSDITAGVLSSRMREASELTLFIDIGTNGEIALGTADWLITCAASAGPAFEGAGVLFGMRATEGAVEEIWINERTYEPDYRVIGNVRPQGLCGSALINLLGELFVTKVMDKAGNINLDLQCPRVREGEYGPEYVVAWAEETEEGVGDIVFTKADIDNLLRAKAAIYGGYEVLARAVGVDLADVHEILIGGNFGKYINVEKAVQIGLLPDLPWDRFHFLGNTAVRGAYMALLSRTMRERVREIANMMTYLELSADNSFYDAFSAAMFLPHTDWERFPSVQKLFKDGKE
jgi:uncharacterized 2Fe-2S/4Fe-4S cluster protein (DUF4445 family)